LDLLEHFLLILLSLEHAAIPIVLCFFALVQCGSLLDLLQVLTVVAAILIILIELPLRAQLGGFLQERIPLFLILVEKQVVPLEEFLLEFLQQRLHLLPLLLLLHDLQDLVVVEPLRNTKPFRVRLVHILLQFPRSELLVGLGAEDLNL